ncbi:MAG: hypothetical protein HXS52_12075 [Theionarchaea archaeon]|nr:hypothetical protein [Theionarchaea archaeon]MBU7038659.1 hypothetical protein [Theionarchaea archaeon]
MKALRVNKKLWTNVLIVDMNESPSLCEIIVTPYGVCGCGGCCCAFYCRTLIC